MNKYLLFLGVILLSGCGSSPIKFESKQAIDVGKILAQVNNAIEAAIDPTDKEFPPISSVQLDLEVTVASTFEGKLPIDLLTAGVSTEHQKLHHITMTFVPKAADVSPAKPAEVSNSKLTAAIRAVYKSVAHASTTFKFQHGSITLQCMLKVGADAGISGLGLVPIQIDTTETSQTVQSITLNFGVDPRMQSTVVPQASASTQD